jgi:AcrR family transcriptional regulator
MTAKEKRREQIIEKASELFAMRDFHAVQMDEIAIAAEVAKGTLYNHFASKEDLYISTIRTRLQSLADLLQTKYQSRDDPWRNLRSFVIHYERFMLRHPHFFRILRKCDALFAAEPDGELRRIRLRAREILGEVLSAGARLGRFRKMEPAAAADLILGMVEAQILAHLDAGARENGYEAILDLLKTGLSKNHGKEPR